MSSQWVAVITDAMDEKTVSSQISLASQSAGNVSGNAADVWSYFRTLENYFSGGTTGSKSLKIQVQNGAVAASGTITFSSIANNDTITVNGTVFTAKTSGATGNQFNIGASDTTAAANAVVAINASATAVVSNVVLATSAAAVITITSLVPGPIGNLGTLAISAHGSVSGANLTGGTVVGQGSVSEGV